MISGSRSISSQELMRMLWTLQVCGKKLLKHLLPWQLLLSSNQTGQIF